MASLNTMVRQCAGLVDTKDVDHRTNDFLKRVVAQTNGGDNTTSLTERQISWLEDIYERHFAG